ncbi:protease, S2P-M50-like family 1 [Syntrophotalea carbinolica DSM 2380]|uniref:Protease, S2P-M50-like family 1 n=1 Tax=Syntrophotalea carbinolica (strain DSM 2380 / NBRC 103641 / GraBd1) TaxID=338963 RepID=Q3A510_SYNC1|nr:site-2 protease family protein [Syntrophotalea carbinolica]ABA88547.2 protease, S2P-M50-like family 1 [Syntrophotalea carbinolica DSM 2380]
MDLFFQKLSIILVPGLLAITVHEVAHGWVAERLGDPTARLLGRLTLNPFKHVDPIGTLLLFFIGFGWARPVPVNPGNLKDPRRNMMWVALGGPTANLGLALLSALVLRGLGPLSGAAAHGGLALVVDPLVLMAAFSLYVNVILMVINLMPIPPLDGGRVLIGLLPEKPAAAVARLEPFGFFAVILLFFFSPLSERVLLPVVVSVTSVLAGPQWFLVQKVFVMLFRS